MILVIFVAVVFVVLSFFYKVPACDDKIQNGDEQGVDCGGSCDVLCTADTLTPVVLWSKTFNISGDVYTAVAFVENPNINSENRSATYQFQIYDSDGKLVTVRNGTTFIPKNKKFAIFETGLMLKNNKPKSTDFKFISFGPWQKNTTEDPSIYLSYGTINSATTSPNLIGTVTNKSLQNISRIELSVFVLDKQENTVATSRTFIDNLLKNSSQDFVFTWQKPFTEEISAINVIYHFVTN